MIRGIKKIGEFVRKETVLSVALFLAVISAFIVPPDSAYVDYIDFRTLAILIFVLNDLIVIYYIQFSEFSKGPKIILKVCSSAAITFNVPLSTFF